MTNHTTTPSQPEFGARFSEQEFHLMMYLLMGCGLRRQEILNLRARSIDVKQRILTVTSPKTRTTRTVTLSPVLADLLAGYLKGRTPGRLMARYWVDCLRKYLPWSQ